MYKLASESATTQKKKFCKLHKWRQKPVDPTDPDSPVYLVCDECKWVFGTDGNEESDGKDSWK